MDEESDDEIDEEGEGEVEEGISDVIDAERVGVAHFFVGG